MTICSQGINTMRFPYGLGTNHRLVERFVDYRCELRSRGSSQTKPFSTSYWQELVKTVRAAALKYSGRHIFRSTGQDGDACECKSALCAAPRTTEIGGVICAPQCQCCCSSSAIQTLANRNHCLSSSDDYLELPGLIRGR